MHSRIAPHRAAGALAVVALLVALSFVSGCASSKRALVYPFNPDSALVLPPHWNADVPDSALAYDDALDAWEFGRNDGRMNYRPDARLRPPGYTEVYTRDRFYTFSGRLHENSRYEIRSYRAR